MDAHRYTTMVERDGLRLLEAAAADLSAPVPACPGWSVADLVGHMGQIHGWVTSLLVSLPTTRPERILDDVNQQDVIGFARVRLDAVLEALAATDAETPCWNWGPGESAGFYHRRMAVETLVHRIDVEDAVGLPTAVDGELAADGVDELITVGLRSSTRPDKTFVYPDTSLHLHRTDGEGEWLLRSSEGRLIATREHAKGDAAVRGSGEALLRYLWGRGKADVEVFGDAAVAHAWSGLAP